MHPEVAAVIASREIRSQHRFLQRWSKWDQKDEDMWTRHDSNGHAMPYGICNMCEYLRAQEEN